MARRGRALRSSLRSGGPREVDMRWTQAAEVAFTYLAPRLCAEPQSALRLQELDVLLASKGTRLGIPAAVDQSCGHMCTPPPLDVLHRRHGTDVPRVHVCVAYPQSPAWRVQHPNATQF
jgi:hypothetical protein